jgi:hypothetical protein
MTAKPPRDALREAGLTLLVLTMLALLFYAPIVFGGKTLLLRDLYTQFHGPRWWYRESLQAGAIPYWNPYLDCGVPFLANPQNGVLYPFSLLFLLLPFGPGLTAYVALHSILLGFFSYLLGRGLGLAFWGALLAGIVAGFSGLPLKQVEFLELVGGLAWTPLVLLAGWKCLTEPRPGWAALLGTALGLQLLAGSPYPPLYSCLGLGCAALASIGGGASRRGLVYLVLGGLLGLLVGCAQYVPTLLLVRGVPATDLAEIMQPRFSLRFRDLLGFLSPWLAGFPNWQKCFSVGLVALFFAASALRPRPAAADAPVPPLTGSRFGFCLLLVVAGFVFARGDYWGIDRLMAALPLVSRAAKWPTLGLSLTIIGGGLLAGAGLQRWLQSGQLDRPRSWLLGFVPVGGLTLALALDAIRGGPWLASIRAHLQEALIVYRSQSVIAGSPPAPEAARLAAIGGLLVLLLWAGRRVAGRRALAPAACLLVGAELFTAGRNLNFQAPTDLYADPAPSELRQILGDHYDAGSARILVPESFAKFSDLAYGSQVLDEFRILRRLFNQDTVMSWQVATTQGGGSVGLPDYEYRLQPLLDALAVQGSPVAHRILGAWNITILLQGSLDAAGLHCDVIANDLALPRARLVERTINIRTSQDAFETIARGRWDPATALAAWDQSLPNSPAAPGEPGTAGPPEYGPGGIRVRCDVQRPCLLVLAENWAEGWSARIDGAPTPVYRVNFLQQAVRLAPGRHEVDFHYTAPGAQGGFLLAGLGLCGIGGCALARRKR